MMLKQVDLTCTYYVNILNTENLGIQYWCYVPYVYSPYRINTRFTAIINGFMYLSYYTANAIMFTVLTNTNYLMFNYYPP